MTGITREGRASPGLKCVKVLGRKGVEVSYYVKEIGFPSPKESHGNSSFH